MDEELDAVKSFEKSRKRKRKFKDIDAKTEECLDPRETRMVVAFNLDLYDLVETFFFSRWNCNGNFLKVWGKEVGNFSCADWHW